MQLEGGGQGESSNFIFSICTEHGSGWGPGVQPCSWRWECHRRMLVPRPVVLKYAHLASKISRCKSFAKLVEWESFYFKRVRGKACSPAGFLLNSFSSITKLLHKLLQLALCQQNVIINTAMESANRSEILTGRHCKRHTKPQTFGESEEGKGEGGAKTAIWTPYELTELIEEQRSVTKTGQCQQVSRLADVNASALVNRSSMGTGLRQAKGLLCVLDDPQ